MSAYVRACVCASAALALAEKAKESHTKEGEGEAREGRRGKSTLAHHCSIGPASLPS